MAMIVADDRCTAAGVFTQNRVVAAPVRVSRSRVPASGVRGVLLNSGNANACTGAAGLENARRMAALAAGRIGCEPEQVLVCSTGIIGERLPMERIEAACGDLFARLGNGPESVEAAARAMMTTDTVPKYSGRSAAIDGATVQVTGLAKGAAMIGPNMATMLAVVLTDAPLNAETADRLLRDAVGDSFNAISVEGHMSTNDTVLLLAGGAAHPGELSVSGTEALAGLISDVCVELAKAIVDDAEGAQHRITIDVEGLRSRDEARRVARTVADSPLVKTAVYGADPNWGRIVSAAGYAGVDFEEEQLSLWLNDVLLYEHGMPVAFDAERLSDHLRQGREVHIRLAFALGQAASRFWTSDLTEEYIRLNAEYHT